MPPFLPEPEGHPPLLEARAEILRPIDRVEQGEIARPARHGGIEALLAHEIDIGQAFDDEVPDQLLDEDIRRRDGAAVGLPGHVATAGHDSRQIVGDEAGDLGQEASDGQHFGRRQAPRAAGCDVTSPT